MLRQEFLGHGRAPHVIERSAEISSELKKQRQCICPRPGSQAKLKRSRGPFEFVPTLLHERTGCVTTEYISLHNAPDFSALDCLHNIGIHSSECKHVTRARWNLRLSEAVRHLSQIGRRLKGREHNAYIFGPSFRLAGRLPPSRTADSLQKQVALEI